MIVDEVGMVGTRHMRMLSELVERAGATLLLVGDPLQLPAVEGTPPLQFLARCYGAPVLKDIRRQEEEWAREAARKLAEGHVGEALAMFAERKQITVRDNIDEAVRQACLDWTEEGLLTPRRALILANRNDVAHKANLLAQEHRLRAGCIQSSLSLRITDEQEDFVYESRVHRGDRVLFTRNSAKYGVKNGSIGDVIEINTFTAEIAVILDNKKYLKINVNRYPHIRLGYAATTYKSQGASIEKIYAIVADNSGDLPSSYVKGSRAIEQTEWYTIKALLNPYLENVAQSPLVKRMSRKPDLRLATELLDQAPLELRQRKIRLREIPDFAAQPPEEKPRRKVVGMPRTFWVVTTPTPVSTLSDICFHCDFAQFAAYVNENPSFNPKKMVGVYAAKKDAVAAASQLLENPCRPAPAGAPITIVGMPQSFWVVTKPALTSTRDDICFETSFPGFVRQIRGGLTVDEISVICTTRERAVATAARLLETMLRGDITHVPISRIHEPMKIVGMPKTFWVVMTPTPASQLHQICFHSGIERFILHVADGLPIEDVAGIYASKQDAVTAAKGFLQAVRTSPYATTSQCRSPLTTVGMPQTFWIVKTPTLSSTMADICLECSFQQLALHVRDGLVAQDIAAVYASKEDAIARASNFLKSANEVRTDLIAKGRLLQQTTPQPSLAPESAQPATPAESVSTRGSRSEPKPLKPATPAETSQPLSRSAAPEHVDPIRRPPTPATPPLAANALGHDSSQKASPPRPSSSSPSIQPPAPAAASPPAAAAHAPTPEPIRQAPTPATPAETSQPLAPPAAPQHVDPIRRPPMPAARPLAADSSGHNSTQKASPPRPSSSSPSIQPPAPAAASPPAAAAHAPTPEPIRQAPTPATPAVPSQPLAPPAAPQHVDPIRRPPMPAARPLAADSSGHDSTQKASPPRPSSSSPSIQPPAPAAPQAPSPEPVRPAPQPAIPAETLPPLPAPANAEPALPKIPLPSFPPLPTMPVPQTAAAAASAADGYQRMRLTAATNEVGRGASLLANCVDPTRPPPPRGQAINYAADSVRVRRIQPKPSASMSLAAAARAGMFSLRGTGSMDRVEVDCPVGELWEITVENALGVVSSQDDIQGALDHYAAPPIMGVLSDLDALESELRKHRLPYHCLLLSLFASLRREICWLLPEAQDPQHVKQILLRRFCDMLYCEPVAYDIFKFLREQIARIDAVTNAKLLRNLLLTFTGQPSETSLRRLALALAEGSDIDESFNQCLSDVYTPAPPGLRNTSFDRIRKALQKLMGVVLSANATWQLSPPQHDAIHTTLCRAANIQKHPNPHYLDVLGRQFRFDREDLASSPLLYHVWRYMTLYIRGRQDQANQLYRAAPDQWRKNDYQYE